MLKTQSYYDRALTSVKLVLKLEDCFAPLTIAVARKGGRLQEGRAVICHHWGAKVKKFSDSSGVKKGR